MARQRLTLATTVTTLFLHRTAMPDSSSPQVSDALTSITPLIATLAQARKQQQMTQAELASQAGLSRMTVQRLESNGLDPRLSTLHEMARVLGYVLLAVPQGAENRVQQALQQHRTAETAPL